jgi:hypothetical protein
MVDVDQQCLHEIVFSHNWNLRGWIAMVDVYPFSVQVARVGCVGSA